MVGALAEILLKKKFYKDQMDSLLMNYVFPEFSHAKGNIEFQKNNTILFN